MMKDESINGADIRRAGNGWFNRNRELHEEKKKSYGAEIVTDFLVKYCEKYDVKEIRILEVGCSFGYNLEYMRKSIKGARVFGIDPSAEAIDYGKEIFGNVRLTEGIANSIPFENNFFDVIFLGHCLYQVPREVLTDTVNETDRCLKYGGFLAITDFDVTHPIIKKSIHKTDLTVYKDDYAKCFTEKNYTLIKKESYGDPDLFFETDMDKRVHTSILFKEMI